MKMNDLGSDFSKSYLIYIEECLGTFYSKRPSGPHLPLCSVGDNCVWVTIVWVTIVWVAIVCGDNCLSAIVWMTIVWVAIVFQPILVMWTQNLPKISPL